MWTHFMRERQIRLSKKCENNNSNNNMPRALRDQGLSRFWIFLDFCTETPNAVESDAHRCHEFRIN